jgi:hypothetical protein
MFLYLWRERERGDRGGVGRGVREGKEIVGRRMGGWEGSRPRGRKRLFESAFGPSKNGDFVGEAYVHGLMDGETLSDSSGVKQKAQMFHFT